MSDLVRHWGRKLYLWLDRYYGEEPRGTYTAVFDHQRGVLRLEPETTGTTGQTARLDFHAMPSPACSTCNSTEGFYDGPNGVPRCSKCFHDQDPSPSGPAKDKAEDAPKNVMTTEGTVQDKAVRGPKERKR